MKSRFDDLYEKILKINELYSKVPSNMWDDVFKTLYEAALENTSTNMYEQAILKKSSEKKLQLSDIIDLSKLKSNIDKSLYFVYYLELLEIYPITIDHIEACYSISNNEISKNKLSQNLRDLTNSKYRYLRFDSNGYSTTPDGKIACARKNFLIVDNSDLD